MSAMDTVWRLLGRLWTPFELPRPSGPHAVGCTWHVFTDTARPERFATKPGARRELPVRIWYPAAPGSTGPRAPYAPPESLNAILPQGLAQRRLAVQSHSIVDAPMAELTSDPKAPVLVFSHGYTGYAEQNTVQMEELASRGYVVASIAHPGEAAWAPFVAGGGMAFAPILTERSRQRARAQLQQTRQQRRALAQIMSELRTAMESPDEATRQSAFKAYLASFPEPIQSESVREWAQDTAVVVDHLQALQDGALPSRFQGRLDLTRLGVFGMSYGGATAVEFARTDARCRAAINLDGSCFGGIATGHLDTPLLLISSSADCAAQRPVLDRVNGPAHLVTVPDTSHGAFTDLPLIFPRWLRRSRMVGGMDALHRQAILNDCITAFFDRHLRQAPAAFEQLPKRYPELHWTTPIRADAAALAMSGVH